MKTQRVSMTNDEYNEYRNCVFEEFRGILSFSFQFLNGVISHQPKHENNR